MSLIELFCDVDDFCQSLSKKEAQFYLGQSTSKGRKPTLDTSEVMTILIHFHQAGYRTFKSYYVDYVTIHLRSEFPALVSYNRFVELTSLVLKPLCLYLHSRFGSVTGLSFIDSTPLAVCHNRRIARHRTFAHLAGRGKNSVDWFYGFKLHLVINEVGQLLACYLTPANVDDRQPVPHLARRLFGKLFGDKGYLSQPLFEQLLARGVQLITPRRRNMPNRLISLWDKILLRKRTLIETVNDQLKNISQIEHSRHRSVNNFLVNVMAGLIAYTHQPKKPALHLSPNQLALLPSIL